MLKGEFIAYYCNHKSFRRFWATTRHHFSPKISIDLFPLFSILAQLAERLLRAQLVHQTRQTLSHLPQSPNFRCNQIIASNIPSIYLDQAPSSSTNLKQIIPTRPNSIPLSINPSNWQTSLLNVFYP